MFLFENIVKNIALKLEQLSSTWDLSKAKAFPNYGNEQLSTKAKYLKSTAVKLAAIYLDNADDGILVFEKCKLILAKKGRKSKLWL